MQRRLPLAAFGAALLLAGCGSTGVPEAGDVGEGEEIFTQKCGSCHTLADAGTKGAVGPDLDAAFDRSRNVDGFDESTIRGVVRNMIEYPVPPMPDRGQLDITDEQADAIASYVASVAAMPQDDAVAGGATTGGGAETTSDGTQDLDGESIFATAGCGSCHVLEAAGSTGTLGPSLDDSDEDVPGAQEQIAKGGGGMPAFEGQLTDAEIQALAEYVVSARGG